MRAAKAVEAVGHGIRLIESLGSASPRAIRNYIKTIMLPAFAYGSEAWYTGTTRGIAHPLDKVLKVRNYLLKKGLGLKRTTPMNAI